MVDRLYGACNKSDFECFRNCHSIRSDYGTKNAPAELRELQGQLTAEDSPVETVVGSVSAADNGPPSLPPSPTSVPSDHPESDEWVLLQVDGMGSNCHVTLGSVPLIHTERLMGGLAHILKTDLAFGYMA